ncbi:ATP-binding region, ATPase-like protein [Acidithiobacillus sp. GGI-221]|nr:ATP-binding region, ATPase-like protein [Acidithiobacillus sp. GGI-221]
MEPHNGVEGTFIRMEGVTNMPTVRFLESAVKGFPVPVYLDQSHTPLDNIHAVDAMDWAKTEIGLVHIRNLHRTFHNPAIYLQGLSINAGFHERYIEDNVVVHLDPEKFFGRLPDRASVIDPDKANMTIRSALIKLYVERLHQTKTGMLAQNLGQEFVRDYGTTCMKYCKELLNDVPYLPNDVVTGYVANLDINMDNSVTDLPTNPIPMNTVDDGTAKLFAGDNGGYDTENLPHMALIQACDGIIVDAGKLDSEHWVHPFVHRLKGDIRIVLTEQQPVFKIDGCFVCGEEVVLGAVLSLSGSFYIGGNLIEMGATYDGSVFDNQEQRFYVPRASSGYGAVRQASDYLEDDDYHADAFDEDDDLFARLVSEARNPDPAALLRQLLLDLGLKRYNSLQEKSFQVTIGEDGAVKVTLA